ncbi:MAG: serine hydrolase [Proteobacteria bacterium]|nr:serine hydrolase [Pseudomonadota bacterium]
MREHLIAAAAIAALAQTLSLAPAAAAGKHLAGKELAGAPAYDSASGVPDPAGFFTTATPAPTFRNVEETFPTRRIAPGPAASPLGAPTASLDIQYRFDDASHSIADFVARTDTTGLLILKGDQILFEGYYQGADPQDLFMSFSVGKSFTSTLVGFALADGKLKSLDDPIVTYLPELAGSAYAKATVKHVLQMATGTSFTEEYENKDSDIAVFAGTVARNQGGLYDFCRSFKGAYAPGTKFYYATCNTEVLGALVQRVTGRSLSAYLSEKLWRPMGAEAAARWILDAPGSGGREVAGGGLQVRLRDYGRFGLLFANRGRWNGAQLLPAGWAEAATRPGDPYVEHGKLEPGYPLGYGYQWWCLPGANQRFAAEGIHGQFIVVDPVQKLVMVKLSSWLHAWDDKKEAETYAFFAALADALH